MPGRGPATSDPALRNDEEERPVREDVVVADVGTRSATADVRRVVAPVDEHLALEVARGAVAPERVPLDLGVLVDEVVAVRIGGRHDAGRVDVDAGRLDAVDAGE